MIKEPKSEQTLDARLDTQRRLSRYGRDKSDLKGVRLGTRSAWDFGSVRSKAVLGGCITSIRCALPELDAIFADYTGLGPRARSWQALNAAIGGRERASGIHQLVTRDLLRPLDPE